MALTERHGHLKLNLCTSPLLTNLSNSRPASPSEESSPDPDPISTGSMINLQVGERRFTTTLVTLTTESGFFSSMFSSHWRQNNNKQADGACFVDADPDLFVHILRYLRHGQLPIFYANGTGPDYGLYAAVLGEARYFQIDRLVQWLERMRYLDVVKVQRIAFHAEELDVLQETNLASEDIEYHPFRTTRKVYVCPRDLADHRGKPYACRKLCHEARGDDEPEHEEEPVVETLIIRKKVLFNHNLCVDG